MKKKIYIHLGFPRTGTTALQYELKKFKKIKLFSRNSDEDIKEFYSFLYKLIEFKKNKHSIKKLTKDFNKIKFNGKINVISEEGLLSENYWRENNIYESIKVLSMIMKKSNFDYKFIIVIRNQYDLIKSIFNYFFISFFFQKKIYNSKLIFEKKEYTNIVNSFDYFKLYNFLKKEKINFNFLIYENNHYSKFFNLLKLKTPINIKIRNNKIYSKYIESIRVWLKFNNFSIKNLLRFLNLIRRYLFLYFKEIFVKFFFYKNYINKTLIKNFYYKSNLKLSKFLNLPDDYYF